MKPRIARGPFMPIVRLSKDAIPGVAPTTKPLRTLGKLLSFILKTFVNLEKPCLSMPHRVRWSGPRQQWRSTMPEFPRGLSAREFIRALHADGFRLTRTRGSHHVYRHSDGRRS